MLSVDYASYVQYGTVVVEVRTFRVKGAVANHLGRVEYASVAKVDGHV